MTFDKSTMKMNETTYKPIFQKKKKHTHTHTHTQFSKELR